MTSEHHPENGTGTLSTAELHAVLGSSDRRQVLRFFQDRGRSVANLDELGAHLSGRDGGFEDSDLAKLSLHHAVLPNLAETGVLDYDVRSNVIRYRGHARLEAILPESSTA